MSAIHRGTAAISGLLFLAIAAPPAQTGAKDAPAREKVAVFYVGNWLLDNSMPPWHNRLGRSAGKQWEVAVRTDLKLLPYMNLYYFTYAWAYGSTDVWTDHERAPLRKVLEERPWDAMVIQAYGWVGLHRDKGSMGRWYREELQRDLGNTDFGDVESMSAMFRRFLEHHPEGELIVLESLPELEVKKQPDGSPVMHATAGGPEPAPDREGFDYPRHWETVKYDPKQDEHGRTHSTRDYTRRLMEALQRRFPEQAGKGRLRCIPLGDVYSAIEQQARAGKLPDVRSVKSFYSDTLHQSSGLPRYVLAATMYAVLFNERPHALDWKIYNDPQAYRQLGGRNWFYVHVPDLGEHVAVTPERAGAVNDAIWDVVTKHPYSGVK